MRIFVMILVAVASALTLVACSVEKLPSPVTTLPASPRPEATPTALAPTLSVSPAPQTTAPMPSVTPDAATATIPPASETSGYSSFLGENAYNISRWFYVTYSNAIWTIEPSPDSGYGQAEFRLVHRIIPDCILGLRDGPRHLAFSHSTKLGSHDWGIYELKTDDLDIWSYTTWVEGWKDTPFVFDLRFPLHVADDVRRTCQADAEAVLATFRPAETPTPTPLPVVDAFGYVTLALSGAPQAATPFQVRYVADTWTHAYHDVLIEPRGGSCSFWLAPTLDRSDSAPVSEEIELGGYVWEVRVLPDPVDGGIIVYETRLDGDRSYRFHLYLAYTESDQIVADCRSRAEAVIATFQPLAAP
ncbi:MAG: hypothetical protein V9H69_09475 [Anaerolineae bacterium]